MENIGRPLLITLVVAAVVVVNVVVLSLLDDDGGDPAGEPVATGTATEAGTAADAAGGTAAGSAGGDGGGDQSGGDGAGGGGGGEQDGRLGTPAGGTYTYASSGTWSLSGGGSSEEHPLPETAESTVQADEGAWRQRLAAGDDYADDFTFALRDGGLDWGAWVLEREFESGPSQTAYTCSGDAPHYVPGEDGREATHVCEGPGITSEGRIQHVGREEVTLGDGSTVPGDHLTYTYTVSGDGVSGEGRFELWLDPTTGLRLREVRTIATRTTNAEGTAFDYREDAEFTLRSTQPG